MPAPWEMNWVSREPAAAIVRERQQQAVEGLTWSDHHDEGTQAPGVMDKLLGRGTERYQTWPERLVRGIGEGIHSAATAPQDVLEGRLDPDSEGVRRALDVATTFGPMGPAARAGDYAIAGAGRRPGPPATTPNLEAARTAGRHRHAPAVRPCLGQQRHAEADPGRAFAADRRIEDRRRASPGPSTRPARRSSGSVTNSAPAPTAPTSAPICRFPSLDKAINANNARMDEMSTATCVATSIQRTVSQ